MLRIYKACLPRLVVAGTFWFAAITYMYAPLHGQDSSAIDQGLLQAIELLDSRDQREREASNQALRSAAKRDPKSQVAICGLVFASFQAGNANETIEWIGSLTSRDKLPKELHVAITKMELCSAIAASNSEVSETRFKDVVKAAINEKTDLAVRREYTELAGKIIELLMKDKTSSPVKTDTLTKANELLTLSSNLSLASTYQGTRKEWEKKAEEIKKWSTKLKAMSEEDRAKVLNKSKSEIEQLEEKLVEAVQSSSKATANLKEVHRTQVVGTKKLQADYRIALAEPTAGGHPGLEPQEPRVPKKSTIRVNDYEFEYDKEGKEKRVSRSQNEMNREIDSTFASMKREYNVKKLEYDRNIGSYRELFRAWLEREEFRRKELAKRLETINGSRVRLLDEEKQAEAERKSESEAWKAIRDEVNEKKWGLKIAAIVVKSMASQTSGSVFCEACLNLLSVTDEKQALVKAFSSRH